MLNIQAHINQNVHTTDVVQNEKHVCKANV